MDNKQAAENFLKYAKQIKEMGFRVFISTREGSNYGWIVNEKDEIGHFYYHLYEGIFLSTEHKPCILGSGFSVGDSNGQSELTKDLINQVFIIYPNWLNPFDRKHVDKIKKWTATEYLEQYWDKQNIKEI